MQIVGVDEVHQVTRREAVLHAAIERIAVGEERHVRRALQQARGVLGIQRRRIDRRAGLGQHQSLEARRGTVVHALHADLASTIRTSVCASLIAAAWRTLSVTTMSRSEAERSEERRVGKECRSRVWRYN